MQVVAKQKRRYRNRLEITANILEIAKEGSRKTRIMYQGNLSFDLAEKYLKQLEQLGLVEVRNIDGEKTYHVTTKGTEYLTDFYILQKHTEITNNKRQVLQNALETRIRA